MAQLQHALSTESNIHDQCIIDSSATCHMCNEKTRFSTYQALQTPLNVILGDRRYLQVVGHGDIVLTTNLPKNLMEAICFMPYSLLELIW